MPKSTLETLQNITINKMNIITDIAVIILAIGLFLTIDRADNQIEQLQERIDVLECSINGGTLTKMDASNAMVVVQATYCDHTK